VTAPAVTGTLPAPLAHVFRHSLREGRVHPLLHAVQRYRREVPHVSAARPPEGARPEAAGEGTSVSAAPGRRQQARTAGEAEGAPLRADLRPLDRHELLTALRGLPPLPSVVLDLIASLGQDELSAAQYAAKISRDQALAAKTLRLANSSFYGRGGQVRSVTEAITVLGLRTVRALVTAAGLSGSFRRHGGFDHDAFWRHSFGSALCAQALADELRRDDGDLAFTVGLLHDIGTLALASLFAPAYAEVVQWRREKDGQGSDAERAVLGIDHAEVGGLIAQQWNFAPTIVDAIRQHHAPAPTAAAVTLTGIAHVADAIVHALGLAGDTGEAVPMLALPVWAACRLDDAACMRLFARTEAQLEAVCEALQN
jgi:putative nucleotidyltransferase with HDIG domain